MSEYTTRTQLDIRELDNLYLATIGGADYYEMRSIVRQANGKRTLIGRASDWPIIELAARNAELTALLVASERRSVEADVHCVELLSRLDAYAEHIAALEAALRDAEPPTIAPTEAEAAERAFLASITLLEAPDDGKIACDWPGCTDRVKPRGLRAHKTKKHGAQQPDVDDVPAHIAEALELPERPVPPLSSVAELALGEPPWRCERCGQATHARSIERPAFCIRCIIAAIEPHTNGHQVAA